MADFDKDGIMSILGGLLGGDKAAEASGLVDKVAKAMSPSGAEYSAPVSSAPASNDTLFDTTEIMGHITNIMGKLNNAKNTKDYHLFNAIRPYVSDVRQPKVDTCLKIVQAVSIMNEFKKDFKK